MEQWNDILSRNALGLPEGSLRSTLHTRPLRGALMPLACPVDTYIPCWEQVLAADRSSKPNDPPGDRWDSGKVLTHIDV